MVVFGNGALMVVFGNGALMVVFGNGALKVVFGNGALKVVFGNGALMVVFWSRRGEITGYWRKLHSGKLHNLHTPLYIVWVIILRRMR
jgi:hypothetical protein